MFLNGNNFEKCGYMYIVVDFQNGSFVVFDLVSIFYSGDEIVFLNFFKYFICKG